MSKKIQNMTSVNFVQKKRFKLTNDSDKCGVNKIEIRLVLQTYTSLYISLLTFTLTSNQATSWSWLLHVWSQHIQTFTRLLFYSLVFPAGFSGIALCRFSDCIDARELYFVCYTVIPVVLKPWWHLFFNFLHLLNTYFYKYFTILSYNSLQWYNLLLVSLRSFNEIYMVFKHTTVLIYTLFNYLFLK